MARPDSSDTLRRHLRTGAEVSPGEICDLLGVSERQARRIVTALGQQDPPLRTRTDGRRAFYSYAPEDLALLTPPEPLTEDEALAVHMAVTAARPAFEHTALAEALDAAVAKLVPPDGTVLTFEPEDGRMAAIGPGTQVVDRDVFRAVRRAVRDGRTLRMTYTNSAGRRREDYACEPYGIVVAGGSWQLVGRDLRRGAVVRYALPDVEAAEPGEAFGGAPDGFDLDAYVRESLGGFAATEVETVRLEVTAAAASSFRRKAYHPTQLTEETRPDGSVVVSFEVGVTPDVVAFVRAFGAAVRVVEPAALAAEVAASARETAALYNR